MITLRKNTTENKTANILWRFVDATVNYHSGISDYGNNVLVFNSPYSVNGQRKVTEMLLIINGHNVRVDAKYLKVGSNYDGMIANDIVSLNYSPEKHMMFVLEGSGAKNNKVVNKFKLAIENGVINSDKKFHFVLIEELEDYIINEFRIFPDWGKPKVFF